MTPAQIRDLSAVSLPEGWTVTVHATYGGADETLILTPTDHPRARAWGVSLHAAGREVGYAARRGNGVEGWILDGEEAARLLLSRMTRALWRLAYPE